MSGSFAHWGLRVGEAIPGPALRPLETVGHEAVLARAIRPVVPDTADGAAYVADTSIDAALLLSV